MITTEKKNKAPEDGNQYAVNSKQKEIINLSKQTENIEFLLASGFWLLASG